MLNRATRNREPTGRQTSPLPEVRGPARDFRSKRDIAAFRQAEDSDERKAAGAAAVVVVL